MLKRIFFGFLVFLLFIAASWYVFQRVDRGYVADMREMEGGERLLIIELKEHETANKTKNEIQRLLEEKAAQAQGTYFSIPWVNEQLNTEFEKGDQVKVFWRGTVMESAPVQIDGTNLIIKFDN